MTIESLGSYVPSKFFRINELGLWAADHALVWSGVGLVVFGLAAWPPALLLGWMALALAFFAWVTEWNGMALPRPGRLPIRSCGCGDPVAFTVRHRDRVWLFSREDDAASGWSDTYTVRHRLNGTDVEPPWGLPLAPGNDWSLHGQAPVASLRFEHHERVSYVTRGSLERALQAGA